jgi:hypothetical protein
MSVCGGIQIRVVTRLQRLFVCEECQSGENVKLGGCRVGEDFRLGKMTVWRGCQLGDDVSFESISSWAESKKKRKRGTRFMRKVMKGRMADS